MEKRLWEGVEDPDEYIARTVGPMSDRFGGPETSASIPAYVVMDGFNIILQIWKMCMNQQH